MNHEVPDPILEIPQILNGPQIKEITTHKTIAKQHIIRENPKMILDAPLLQGVPQIMKDAKYESNFNQHKLRENPRTVHEDMENNDHLLVNSENVNYIYDGLDGFSNTDKEEFPESLHDEKAAAILGKK